MNKLDELIYLAGNMTEKDYIQSSLAVEGNVALRLVRSLLIKIIDIVYGRFPAYKDVQSFRDYTNSKHPFRIWYEGSIHEEVVVLITVGDRESLVVNQDGTFIPVANDTLSLGRHSLLRGRFMAYMRQLQNI